MSEILVVSGRSYYFTQDNFEPSPFKVINAPFKVRNMEIDTFDVIMLAEKNGMFKAIFPKPEDFRRELTIGMANHPVVFEWMQGKVILTFQGKKYDVTNVPFFFIRCGEVFTAGRMRFFAKDKPYNCNVGFVGQCNLEEVKS